MADSSSARREKGEETGKENQRTTSNLEQAESKKMNHYKNTRLNYYSARTAPKKMSLECFKMGRKIGRGRFGCVYVAEERVTGMVVALKLIDLQQVKEEQMESQIVEELKLQLFMSNPNVLKMYGCFRDGEQLCMILEYAEGKCLFNKLNDEVRSVLCRWRRRQLHTIRVKWWLLSSTVTLRIFCTVT
jgi:serine/threonine protein kinase